MRKFVILTDYAKISPTLSVYLDSKARVTFVCGPVGSGKTFASVLKVLLLMMYQAPDRHGFRRSRWVAVRNTYSELRTTTIKDWRAILDEDNEDNFGILGRFSNGGGGAPPSHKLRFKLEDGTTVVSEIIFLALDRPQDVKKLKGTNVTAFWLNEVIELSREIVEFIDGRHGRYPENPTWHGIIGDTNSCDVDHWYYQIGEVLKPKDWLFLRQPGGVMRELKDGAWTGNWIPNPDAENLVNLPGGSEYYSRQVQAKGEDYISVILANEYGMIKDGQPVYQHQWNDRAHAVDDLQYNPELPIAVGLDFGLTPSAIITQRQPSGRIHVLREIVTENTSIEQFAELLLKPCMQMYYPRSEVIYVGDPAGAFREQTKMNTVFAELQSHGIHCVNQFDKDIASQSLEIRLEAVRHYLLMSLDGQPVLLVDKKCSVLRKGFNGGYKYKRIYVSGETRYSDKPDKTGKFSHVHDALQYVMQWYRGASSTKVVRFDRSRFQNPVL